jgi:hypothetical protein
VNEAEEYLASIAAQVRGTGARRLTAELRDHLDDAIAHHLARGCDAAEAARIAFERLGPADELLAAWQAQARARRAQGRRRAGLVAFAAVTASALALVQHASGRQSGPSAPAVTHARCAAAGHAAVGADLAFGVGRMAHCRCGSCTR